MEKYLEKLPKEDFNNFASFCIKYEVNLDYTVEFFQKLIERLEDNLRVWKKSRVQEFLRTNHKYLLNEKEYEIDIKNALPSIRTILFCLMSEKKGSTAGEKSLHENNINIDNKSNQEQKKEKVIPYGYIKNQVRAWLGHTVKEKFKEICNKDNDIIERVKKYVIIKDTYNAIDLIFIEIEKLGFTHHRESKTGLKIQIKDSENTIKENIRVCLNKIPKERSSKKKK